MSSLPPDRQFTTFARECVAAAASRAPADQIQQRIAAAMRTLLSSWQMPDERYRQCQPDAPYGSYLLFLCPQTQVSIVMDVFAPGQVAAIHDHTVWGVFGCVAGREIERHFDVSEKTAHVPVEVSQAFLDPGRISLTDPAGARFHQVECASEQESISLHVYGADIGRLVRRRWHPASGAFVSFSSDYSNDVMGYPPYLPRLS